MNDISVATVDALGRKRIVIRIKGPDVVGSASVYRTTADARALAAAILEECDVAEAVA